MSQYMHNAHILNGIKQWRDSKISFHPARTRIQIISGSLNFETEFVSRFFLRVYAAELRTRVAINK
jgi:hypothetical protein